MSRTVWRIASDTPNYEADDLSGTGAKITGGRWNAAGSPVVYTAETRALACLETFVHLNAGGLPFNRYLVSIELPASLWNGARFETAISLKVGWDAEPAGRVSIGLGMDWLSSMASALLVVPSVVVPEEYNVLINPAHADSKSLVAIKRRRWTYDPRLMKSA